MVYSNFMLWKAIELVCTFKVQTMFLQLMCNFSTCTDEWHPAASTLCPSVLPAKKRSHSYAQNEAQMKHFQRIS